MALNLSGGPDVSERKKNQKNGKLEISRILAIFLRLQLQPTKPGTLFGCLVLHHYLAVLKGEMLIDCSIAARAVTVAADWNVAKTHRSHSRSFSCEAG